MASSLALPDEMARVGHATSGRETYAMVDDDKREFCKYRAIPPSFFFFFLFFFLASRILVVVFPRVSDDGEGIASFLGRALFVSPQPSQLCPG